MLNPIARCGLTAVTLATFFLLGTANADAQIISVPPGTPIPDDAAVLRETLGRGIHAYNSGQVSKAFDTLSMVIGSDLKDPRAHYFRGLAASRMGRSSIAKSDWENGAQLEAKIAGGAKLVGQSLIRVQGTARIQLEGYRQRARLQAKLSGVTQGAAAKKQMQIAESRVLRNPVAGGIAASPSPVAPMTIDAADPFAAVGAAQVASPDALTEKVAGIMADKPVADPAAASDPADAPASDPFDSGAADPFGGGAAGADDDPFGSDTMGGGASDPFADDPADDPFK
ncbi:MAG: hypothetical protein AAFP69_02495 [Planctomycetota bacterium]